MSGQDEGRLAFIIHSTTKKDEEEDIFENQVPDQSNVDLQNAKKTTLTGMDGDFEKAAVRPRFHMGIKTQGITSKNMD